MKEISVDSDTILVLKKSRDKSSELKPYLRMITETLKSMARKKERPLTINVEPPIINIPEQKEMDYKGLAFEISKLMPKPVSKFEPASQVVPRVIVKTIKQEPVDMEKFSRIMMSQMKLLARKIKNKKITIDINKEGATPSG